MIASRLGFSSRTGDGDVGHAVRHRRRGTALEEAIRTAAFDELTEVGYDAFTIESVATRAQTGKASIYRRWPGKQELVLDSFCSGLAKPLEALHELHLNDSVTTREALIRLGQMLGRIFAGPAGDAVRSVIGEAVRDPDLAAAIEREFQQPRINAMMLLIQRGIERGEVRPGAQNELIAEVLPAMLIKRLLVRPTRLTEADIIEIVDVVVIPLLEPR